MTKCLYCGRGTILRVYGVPVCAKCAEDLVAGPKPKYRVPVEAHPRKEYQDCGRAR
jgi:hypothetical protein